MDTRADPVRSYLNSVLECRIEARRTRRKLDQLEARAMSITSQVTGMPRGGNADRDALLAALADVSSDYYRRLADAERHELEVLRFIDRIPIPMHRSILRLRYVDCRKWSSVLAELQRSDVSISRRTMLSMHGKALSAARELYREVFGNDG